MKAGVILGPSRGGFFSKEGSREKSCCSWQQGRKVAGGSHGCGIWCDLAVLARAVLLLLCWPWAVIVFDTTVVSVMICHGYKVLEVRPCAWVCGAAGEGPNAAWRRGGCRGLVWRCCYRAGRGLCD